MNPLLVTALALAGLMAGLGQRAIIFSLAVPAGEPARRCCCPACHSPLAARSPQWPLLSLSGRCPACHHRAGPLPLAVEVTTAILLAALAARVQPGLVLAAACWLALCAVPLAFIDAAVRRLPDLLTGPAWSGTALILLLAAATTGHWGNLARAVVGGIALAGFYLAVVLISPAAMGMGDAKASASVGTLLSWLSWQVLIAGVFAGFLLAAVYGIFLLVCGRASRKTHIPFGPFMLAGAFAAILTWHGVGSRF